MEDVTNGFQASSGTEEAEPKIFGKPISSVTLCYLSCSKDAGNAFIGAALVTDHRTRPLEFCYVAPIRPTAIQRLLYGRTLEEHVNVDVIAKKMLQGLSCKQPDIVFVDSNVLLEATRICSAPVALLRRTTEADSDGRKLSLYECKVREGSPYADAVSQAVGVLETPIQLCDPFERITEAVKEALRSKA